jgi:hypothetical protein
MKPGLQSIIQNCALILIPAQTKRLGREPEKQIAPKDVAQTSLCNRLAPSVTIAPN